MANAKRITERAALVLVALLTIGIFVASMHFERQLADQKLMFYQMQALRTSINLFKAINGRNPASLRELIAAEYKFTGEEVHRRFVETPSLSATGEVTDPFGHPYLYDAASGWIRSTTSGYEYW